MLGYFTDPFCSFGLVAGEVQLRQTHSWHSYMFTKAYLNGNIVWQILLMTIAALL